MTKDVLVSISGKHIDIMNGMAQEYAGEDDGIEVVTPASYYLRNGKHYIIYDEVVEGMAGAKRKKNKITGTDGGEIMRRGFVLHHHVFCEKKKKIYK